jgi:pyridoxamine 5'-phosphate oxidase family protein
MVSYDNETGAVDITGRGFETTKKFRDVQRTGKAALVVDDVTEEPWQPRAVEIRGKAEAIEGEEPKIRLWPTRIVSWGVDHANERSARSIPA